MNQKVKGILTREVMMNLITDYWVTYCEPPSVQYISKRTNKVLSNVFYNVRVLRDQGHLIDSKHIVPTWVKDAIREGALQVEYKRVTTEYPEVWKDMTNL